jgi:hypothetical protein
MAPTAELTPAEAKFLLAPNRTSGFDTIKVTLLWLLAGGYLRIEETESFGILRNKKVAHLRLTEMRPPSEPLYVPALIRVVREAQEDGGTVKAVVRHAQKTFGGGGVHFNANFIIPMLVARGLIEQRKFLFIRSQAHTPAGHVELERIKSGLDQARQIPSLLKSEPARAAAMAASLGTLVLLAPTLMPHFKPLSDAMRLHSGGDGSFVGLDTSSSHHGGFDFGGFDFGSLDLGSLGSFDAGMASFDAGFSDGGGGGGDGGGDSGGGGGGD